MLVVCRRRGQRSTGLDIGPCDLRLHFAFCLCPFSLHSFPVISLPHPCLLTSEKLTLETLHWRRHEWRKLTLRRSGILRCTPRRRARYVCYNRIKDALKDYKLWFFILIYVGCAEPIDFPHLLSCERRGLKMRENLLVGECVRSPRDRRVVGRRQAEISQESRSLHDRSPTKYVLHALSH